MNVGTLNIELAANVARLARDMHEAKQTVNNAMGAVEKSVERAKNAFAGLAAGIGIRQIIALTDQYTKFTAQLKLATDSATQYTRAYADVQRISKAAQADLAATGTLYARIANGTRELGLSQSKVADITETVNLALKVSGATAQESASAMLQLSQGFASGTLRGEEFNAVNEAAPRLMKALADGIGVPVGALREMATAGLITSQVMASALPKALAELREEAKSVQTISGAFTLLKNNILEFVGMNAQASGAVSVLTSGIGLLAENLRVLTSVAMGLATIKIAQWMASIVTAVYAKSTAIATSIATMQAERAATLAASSADVARLQTMISLINADRAKAVAQMQSAQATMAATAAMGAHSAAIHANTAATAANAAAISSLAALGKAQAVATAQLTAAQAAHTAALASGGIAATGLSRALGLLGGPIGLITTLLGFGVTAWMLWGKSAEDANKKAKESAEASGAEILASLEKQNAKLRERVALAKAGNGDAAKAGGESVEKLASTLKEINDLKAKGSAISGAEQVYLIELQGRYDAISKALAENKGLVQEIADIGQRSKADEWLAKYATGAEKLAAELAKAKKELGAAFTPELEKRIRDSFMKKDVAKAAKELSAAEKEALDLAMKAAEARAKSRNDEYEAIEKHLQGEESARIEAVKAANDAVRAAQDEYDQYGMTRSQIEEITLARLRDKQAAFDSHTEQYKALQQQIEAREKLIGILKKGEIREASDKAAEEHKKAWERANEDISRSLTDSLMRGFESGKGFGKNLVDTIKNMFKTLVLRPIVSAVVNPVAGALTGAMGFSGAANAAGSSAGGSFAGSAAGGLLGSVGAFGAGASYGAASLFANGLGATLSAGSSMIGAGSIASGIGTIAGALGPIALAVGAVYALVKSMDDSGTIHTGGAARASASGISTMDARGLGFMQINTAADTEKMVSGLASSIVGILDSTATNFGKAAGYSAATAFADDTSKDGAWGALLIEKMGEKLIDWDSSRQSRWAPREFEDGEAGRTQYLAALSASVRTALDDIGLPGWAKNMLNALGDAPAIDQLATVVDQINATQKALKVMGDAIAGFSDLSDAAVSKLIEASGGIDTLAGGANAFYDGYFDEAEKIANTSKQIKTALSGLGLEMPATRDEFRALVEAQIQLGEGGAKAVATLLGVAGAFGTVADAALVAAQNEQALARSRQDLEIRIMELSGDTAGALAAQRTLELAGMDESLRPLQQRIYLLQDEAMATERANVEAENLKVRAMSAVDGAFAGLQRAVDAQRDVVTEAYQSAMASVSDSLEVVNGRVGKLSGLSNALKSAVDRMRLPAEFGASRAAAQAQITAALAIARAGGVLPDADALSGALEIVAQPAEQLYATFQDYQRDFLMQRANIDELSKLTDAQLTTEEKTLSALKDQQKVLESGYQAEMDRLDGVLQTAQDQIAVLNGIDTSIKSVEAALAGFKSAISGALAAGATGGGANSATFGGSGYGSAGGYGGASNGQGATDKLSAVESLYAKYSSMSYLTGEGGAYWASQFNKGIPKADIEKAFQDSVKAVRGFDVGTNYVPSDMLANIHEGERIIPAADNRELMARLRQPSDGSAALVAEIRALREENRNMRAELQAIAQHTNGTRKLLERATPNGSALAVVVEGA